MMDFNLELYATIGHLLTGFGTIVLVILLHKTFRHLDASTKAAKIQTEYKFRPWIGPTGVIKEMESSLNDVKQFEIMLKNFGDIPATNVTVSYIVQLTPISREELYSSDSHIQLGPVLPNMEKRYWLHVPNEIIQKALNEQKMFYTGILFEYPLSFGDSEYGFLSKVKYF